MSAATPAGGFKVWVKFRAVRSCLTVHLRAPRPPSQLTALFPAVRGMVPQSKAKGNSGSVPFHDQPLAAASQAASSTGLFARLCVVTSQCGWRLSNPVAYSKAAEITVGSAEALKKCV